MAKFKQMKTVFAILGFILFSFIVYLGFYNGFYSPKVEIENEGGEIIVYESIVGHYHLTDSVMKNVFNELYEKNGIVITKGFGIYYDDPKEMGENNINFDAGCIVDDKDSIQLSNISELFTIKHCEKTDYIVTDFPLKGKMSIMFGMFKVYPKLNSFCEENGYDSKQAVMEIYDRKEKRIHYRRKLVAIHQ